MGKILKKFFFEKKSSFSDVERNFSVVLLKFSVGLSQLNPTHPKDILSGSSLFLKKLFFFHFFWTSIEKFGAFCRKIFRRARQNCIFSVHRKTFKNWNFLKEKLFPIILGHPAVSFWPFVKKISAELSKLHSMCQWKNLEDVCVLKKNFFLFGHSLTNIRPFVGFFFGWIVKTASYVSRGEFWGKTFFRNLLFSILSGHWAETFRPFLENFSGVVKTISYVSIETFWWKCFFLDKVLSFSAFKEKIVAFCRKCFGSVVKTEFSLSIRKLRRSSILWENNSSLSKHWATSLRPLVKKNNWGCQNSILPVHRNLFDENIFLNEASWFSAFKDKFVALCQKFFGPVVKTEFSLSIRKFWRISSLWEKIHHFWTVCDKSSAFSQKIIGVVKTALYLSIGSFWWTNFLEKKLLIFFGHSAVNFWFFVHNLWAELSKLHSTWQWGNFKEILFLKKSSSFLDVERNFSRFCWTFSVGLSKLNPTQPKNYWSGGSLFLKNLYLFPSFLDIKWKFCGLLSKKFWWARQSCILRVHRNTFKKWIFPINYCFPSFQDSEQKSFVFFFQKNSAVLSKQYLTCPSKHFDEKI